MALLGQQIGRKPLLPQGFEAGAKRLFCKIGGLLAMAMAAACWLSLISWSIDDPSLNNATSEAPSNWIGHWGAISADLVMQSIGLAAIVLLVPMIAWGWHLLNLTVPTTLWWRLLAWPISVLAVAAGLSAIPEPASWPLPNGLGGIMGDVMMAGLRLVGATAPKEVVTLIGGFTLLGLGLWGTIFSSAIPYAVLSQIWNNPQDGSGRIATGALGAAQWPVTKRTFLARVFKSHSVNGPGNSVDIAQAAPVAGGFSPDAGRGVVVPIDGSGQFDPHFDEPPGKESDAATYRIAHTASSPQPLEASSSGGATCIAASFVLPALRLLKKPPLSARAAAVSDAALQENARRLENVLRDFGVNGDIINILPGPVVTLYELKPAPGTKSSRIIALADDIARSMSAISARVAVIPGRDAIGIELPNARRELVYLRELLEANEFIQSGAELELALGKDIGGQPVTVDLSSMPHLLVAGTTGSGKSVGINTMILSLLYRLTPEQCKFILIDPKMLELSAYDGIPHLLAPVVTDPKRAIIALKWTVKEMEERYKKMSKLGVRNMHGFNARVLEARANGKTITRTVQTGFDRETGEAIYEQEMMDYEPLPYIVVIVDEMADLMMMAGKEIEGAVQRLAQMARAAGIHLITATQRPSVDVITGTIKANFPTRISFQVTSKIDSRTILGEQGAEQLLGQGDMLYMAGGGRITRVHGPFVSDDDVERIVRHLRKQGVPQYIEEVTEATEDGNAGASDGATGGNDLYGQAVAIVLRDSKASTSYIQRRLSIGYNRAATLVERMEEEGVISPANNAGRRKILIGGDAATTPY